MTTLPTPQLKTWFRDLLHPWKIGLLFFFILLCVNSQHMFNPPYWDEIIGLHNQAIFIAKHNFNPIVFKLGKEVRIKEPHLPLAEHTMVYPYSVIPWIHAVFYRFLSPLNAHLAGHLFNTICLSIAAALAYSIMKTRRQNAFLALLFTALAFLDPVLAGQTASLGQECPMVAMTMLIVFLLSQKKYKWALATSLLAITCRPTGLVTFVAILCLFFYRFSIHWKNFSPKKKKVILFLSFLLLLLGASPLLIHHDVIFIDLPTAWKSLPVKLPNVFLYFALETLAATLSAIVLLRGKSLRSLDDDSLFRLVLLLVVWFLFIALNLFTVTPPRYVTFAILPAFVLMSESAPSNPKYLLPLACLAALLLLLHPMRPLPAHLARSGEYLERSRDYLKDLRANQMICKFIETQIPYDTPVVVKWPFGQMLTMPEFGYVDKPHPNVYVAGFLYPKYAPVKQLNCNDTIPDNAVCLFTATSLTYDRPRIATPYTPRIIWKDQSLPGECILFYMR